MISAVVLTKNEERNIEECLKTLGFCDEVVVVDDGSTDATREIAQNLGAKVFVRDMEMDFSDQSNFGMEKVKGEWIFFVDADERVSEKLGEEVKRVVSGSVDFDGYFMKRRDFIWGKWFEHGESGNQKVLRLIKKGSGKWRRRVHPYFEIKGSTSELANPLLHYPHPTATKFVASVDRWSTWHALANREEGKKSSLFKICFWPLGHFLKNYFLSLGFLDGIQGFLFAYFMGFHSFLAWGKLWILQRSFNKV
jgi:glycosyltransferase involved in cell wall biosynthesis